MRALGTPCWSRTSRGDGEGAPGRVETPVKTAVNKWEGTPACEGVREESKLD